MSLLRFLFPVKRYTASQSWLLLAARIVFGLLFMSHAAAKIADFDTLAAAFPDPYGLGSRFSLALAIFAEGVCSALFIAGVLYRLSLLPMIFMLATAAFVVHHGDPFSSKELAVVYLVVFVLLFFAGPGRYAPDRLIALRLVATRSTP